MENLSDILRRTISNRPSRRVDDTVHDQPTRSDVGKCPICNGVGWLTNNVPVTDPDFGQVYPCECQKSDLNGARRSQALERYSRLGILRASTFAAVNPAGVICGIPNCRYPTGCGGCRLRRRGAATVVQEASSPSRPSHWNGRFPGPSCRLRGVSSSSRFPLAARPQSWKPDPAGWASRAAGC